MIAQSPMDITLETPLLGGLSPQTFMRRHWQKKPLLVRQALPAGAELIGRAQLFELAGHEEVESRLVVHAAAGDWSLRTGPMPRSSLPPLKQAGWTLLVQGLDLHVAAARELLERFRFVPDARLDDIMLSFATDGGGVGPHVDSYDVFLLQVQGRRRWRIGRVARPEFMAEVPLKILTNFHAENEWLLEPGDMLYLPPGWAHEGVAEGECMTCSVGFRAPGREEIAREVLQRVLDGADAPEGDVLYRDPTQAATVQPGLVPEALREFATAAVLRWLDDPQALACALGEVLSEPKRGVWFDDGDDAAAAESAGVKLDQRTRMLYDERHVFINGESFRAAGRDARLIRRLSDDRALSAKDVAALSDEARELVGEWLAAGWLRAAS
jgi:50S ribosomal protein L16 3-hydroxylase